MARAHSRGVILSSFPSLPVSCLHSPASSQDRRGDTSPSAAERWKTSDKNSLSQQHRCKGEPKPPKHTPAPPQAASHVPPYLLLQRCPWWLVNVDVVFLCPLFPRKKIHTGYSLPLGPVVPKARQGCDPPGRGSGHGNGCGTPGHHAFVSTASPLPQVPPLFLEVLCRMQRWERTRTKLKHQGNVTSSHEAVYLQPESQSLPESLSLLESAMKACGEGMHEEENHLSTKRVPVKAIQSPWLGNQLLRDSACLLPQRVTTEA